MRELKVIQAGREEARSPVSAPASPTIVHILEVLPGAQVRVADAQGDEHIATLTASVSRLDRESLIGREALVVFANSDASRPIVLDLIGEAEGFTVRPAATENPDDALRARVDGEEVVIRAEQRLELRCGKASITIDADGKISIKGAHLYNRATGPIRIKGGHVDIN